MQVYGELLDRIHKNRERLEAEEYRAPLIFRQGGDWPGDWQGRTLLALCCHYRAAESRETKAGVLDQIEGILGGLDGETNEDGYFGEVFDGAAVNEQQLSGNSWFLRGLCSFYEIFPRPEIMQRLKKIARSYLAGLAPYYEKYPTVKREDGGVGGHLQKATAGGWHLSSDVGCGFILLDGITHTYEVTGEESLLPVIRIMIEKFADLDYVRYNCQTHAVLSGTRGVLRLYRLLREKDLLALAERNFKIYTEYGMTLNYANYNWFGKPYWTETCAVVDSLMVAQQLYADTGERKYLEFLNRCYTNALRVSQRPNGGAGCETCLNDGNDCLKNYLYEAYFCCTMRIAEGLYSLGAGGIMHRDGAAVVPIPMDVEDEDLSVRVTETDAGARICLRVKQGGKPVLIYIPAHSRVSGIGAKLQGGMLEVAPCGTGEYVFDVEYADHVEIRQNTEVHMRGDWLMMIGNKNEHARRERVRNCLRLPDRKAVEEAEQFV